MRALKPACLILLSGLIGFAGCARKEPPSVKAEPVASAAKPEELLVGKWQLVADDNVSKSIDWAFLGGAPQKAEVLRITEDGQFRVQPDAEPPGPQSKGVGYGNYEYHEGTLSVEGPRFQVVGTTLGDPAEKPNNVPAPPPAKKLKAVVKEGELVLSDDKGNVQKFKRIPSVAGSVKVKGLPVCCAGCSAELKKELAKSASISDVVVDVKDKSATLKIKDKDETGPVILALSRAGMRGEVIVDGQSPTGVFTRVGGVIGIVGAPPVTEIKLNHVHVCCAACEANLAKALPGLKLTFAGDGPLKRLTISGEKLDFAKVLNGLSDAGYDYQVDSSK